MHVNSSCDCDAFAYREFLIELVGQQGIWQLPEVELAQRADAVDVLDVNIFGQVGDLLRIELMPEETGEKDKCSPILGSLARLRQKHHPTTACLTCTIPRAAAEIHLDKKHQSTQTWAFAPSDHL